MKIGAIIQARMGSTRLPGKIMMDISGKPMIWHVVDRLKRSEKLNEIVIASTFDSKNDVLEAFADDNNINFFRGSEEDVLQRYLDGAEKYNIDLIVRITSDCPLIDPNIVDCVINEHIDSNAHYTSNTQQRSFPRGLDVEVFSRDSLLRIDRLAIKKYQREHVTPFFYENPSEFKLNNVTTEGKIRQPYLRLCVDTEEDLKFVREVFKRLYKPPDIIKIEDIIDLIEKEPELAMINKNIKQKRLKE